MAAHRLSTDLERKVSNGSQGAGTAIQNINLAPILNFCLKRNSQLCAIFVAFSVHTGGKFAPIRFMWVILLPLSPVSRGAALYRIP